MPQRTTGCPIVRSTPKPDGGLGRQRAITGLMHRNKFSFYSINSVR